MSTEYLYFLMTGKWGISSSAVTPFYLAEQEKKQYIPEILDILDISGDMLPPIVNSGEFLGYVTEQAEGITGLKKGTPVILGSFDHPSAARGVGVVNEGEILLSCGTSWVAFFPINDRKKILDAKMLTDPFLSHKGGAWAGMVSVASVAHRISLYVNRYIDNSETAFETLSTLAKSAPSGANGLRINPMAEPDDSIVLKYSLSDIARAIMEGTARLLKEQLDFLSTKKIFATKGIMVGGPSHDPFWLDIIYDICNIELNVVHGQYAGAVGAAYMAGGKIFKADI